MAVSPEKILVVDDEPDLELLIRQRFRKRISAQELTFEFAGDGQEALDLLNEDPEISLVLTDINMPRMDGLTLLSNLKDLDRVLRTIVVSAYGDLGNIRTAMNRGAFDFVTKPIDFQDLDATVQKSLGDLEAYRTAAEAQEALIKLQRELDVARRIQEAALPKKFPDREELDLYATLIPARDVGGDFYDFFFVDDHRLGFAVGDVSGKGLSAAMFMTVCRTLLKAIAMRGGPADKTIREMNRLLQPESLPEMFVTVFYGILDLRTGDVEYCNAGHNVPLVIHADGSVTEVEHAGGVAVCILADFDYAAGHMTLKPGEGLVVFTDGVTEAMNNDGNMFSDEALVETVSGLDGSTASNVIRQIVRDVSNFANGAPQSDDLTGLVLRFGGAAS